MSSRGGKEDKENVGGQAKRGGDKRKKKGSSNGGVATELGNKESKVEVKDLTSDKSADVQPSSGGKEEEKLTHKLGTHCLVLKGDKWVPSKIIKKRPMPNGTDMEYFVRFVRRGRKITSKWVTSEDIQAQSVVQSGKKVGKKRGKRTGRLYWAKMGRTRAEKKKLEETRAINRENREKMLKKFEIKHNETIQFGKYEIETWFSSSYPEEFAKQKKILLCEYCLAYMTYESTFVCHRETCEARSPPGILIYVKGTTFVYMVDGANEFDKLFCQNLSLLGKLFLDEKTLFFDLESFLFYVVCERDEFGAHMVGYFSKEKSSPDGNNLSCIMVLPPFQRMGYGQFLISLSYELSRLEGVVGTPERPLSELGEKAYHLYWSRVLLTRLQRVENLELRRLSSETGMTRTDIIATLQARKMIRFWRGEHTICVTTAHVQAELKKLNPVKLHLDPRYLRSAPAFFAPAELPEKQ